MSHHKSVTDQTLPSRRVLPSRFSSSALVCWRGGTSSCQSHVKGGIMCMRTVSMFKRGKKEKLWTCSWMVARGCDGLSILPKRTWFYDNANGVQRPFKTRYQLNGEPLKTRMHSAIKLLHSLTLSASPGWLPASDNIHGRHSGSSLRWDGTRPFSYLWVIWGQVLTIRTSIFYTAYPHSDRRCAGAYPSRFWIKGRVQPWLVASQSQAMTSHVKCQTRLFQLSQHDI